MKKNVVNVTESIWKALTLGMTGYSERLWAGLSDADFDKRFWGPAKAAGNDSHGRKVKFITIAYGQKTNRITLMRHSHHIWTYPEEFPLEKEVRQMVTEIDNKRKEFAQMCGEISKKMKLPFDICLAFKGREEKLERFVNSIRGVFCIPYREGELLLGRGHARKEIARLGIYIWNVDPNRLKAYILKCLKGKEIFSK